MRNLRASTVQSRKGKATFVMGNTVDPAPSRQGGGDDEENLALVCFHCNLHKGTNLTGIDPQSGEVMRTFHPRRDRWCDHFQWRGLELVGLTAVGRTTIRLLQINAPHRLQLRASLLNWSTMD